MYCLKHRLGDNGQALFELPSLNRFGKKQQRASYPLVRPDLRRAALLHYAEQYRHLASSRRLLAEVSGGGVCGVVCGGGVWGGV